MPTWGETLNELQTTMGPDGSVDIDQMRSERLAAYAAHSGRSVISYAANPFAPNPEVQIHLRDMIGFMEVFKDLPGPNLDLILYTPGGQAEATERIVRYLRSKFSHIRVVVPFVAMSAGTMMAMAADEIVMGKHSQLGPIDPQITIPGKPTMPAGALIDQFREAQKECSADPAAITGWLPTLQQYPPGLLNFCESTQRLAQKLVGEWLEAYMFKRSRSRAQKAEEVARWLADEKEHLSHSRAITRDELRQRGVKVVNLEDDETLQDLALSVHHAVVHTFSSPVFKLIENHVGKRYVESGGAIQLPPMMPLPASFPV